PDAVEPACEASRNNSSPIRASAALSALRHAVEGSTCIPVSPLRSVSGWLMALQSECRSSAQVRKPGAFLLLGSGKFVAAAVRHEMAHSRRAPAPHFFFIGCGGGASSALPSQHALIVTECAPTICFLDADAPEQDGVPGRVFPVGAGRIGHVGDR